MPCINSDGSLTSIAKSILKVLMEPLTEEEIVKKAEMPLFRVRMSIREFLAAELIRQENDKYIITDKGKEKLSL